METIKQMENQKMESKNMENQNMESCEGKSFTKEQDENWNQCRNRCACARELLARQPKSRLGFFPTPFYRLDRLSKKLGVNLWIKRDDFTGMSLFGGNKIRKLEYLIGDAVSQGCEYVFTYGATQSNHAMQTVSACRRMGLKPVLYLVAIVEPDEKELKANLLLDEIMGAEVHIVKIQPGETEEEAEERSFALAKEHQKRLLAEGHKSYDVPMGGASAVGSLGFIEGFVELSEQCEAAGVRPAAIFHATGTGGTMAGLAAGRALVSGEGEDSAGSSCPKKMKDQTDCDLHARPQIISINVSHKDESYLIRTEKLANASLELLGAKERIQYKQDLFMDLNYYAPGYELPNEAASKAIRLLAEEEGLLVDPVYTGKAFAGLLDYVKTGKLQPGSDVVFWHTGGATALFAEKEILGDLV